MRDELLQVRGALCVFRGDASVSACMHGLAGCLVPGTCLSAQATPPTVHCKSAPAPFADRAAAAVTPAATGWYEADECRQPHRCWLLPQG
jgi:hypothetical protein